ncbi:MAG: MATE family efflux transporter [Clostridiales bacterium]|nr:MATE family efflux transporter [Clostridiales bacterium]
MQIFTRDKLFYKTFFVLTTTIALQNIISFGVNLSDNVLIGAYNETSLSGVALVNQVQYMLQMITMGVGSGMIILAARYWGKKECEPIQKITSIGMRICIIFALCLWVIAFFFPHWCLSLFTNEEAVIAEGVKYLQIICFSYIFFAITNTLLYTLRSVETVRIGFYISTSTLIINICLNYILIYGHFGAPRLGIRGSAIATLIARIIEFMIMMIYIKYFDKKIKFRLNVFKTIDRDLLKNFIKYGLPVVLSHAFWGIAIGVQIAILGRLGESVISANSIATTIFQILSVFTYGSASATAVLISKTIGEGKLKTVKEYAITLQFLYLIIGIVTGTILFLCKGLILDFYNITEETKILALQFMTILSVTVIGSTYQIGCLSGIVSGGGETKFAFINDTIFMWLFVLPSSYLCAYVFHLPPPVVFFFLKSDQILKCFVALVKVNRFHWIKTAGI